MRKKKTQPRASADKRRRNEKVTTILVSALALTMLFVVVLLVWQKSHQRAQADYEGQIVDRWGQYSESQQGSRPAFRLLIESQDGKRIAVRVDANVYESAKIGMLIKSQAGQVVLTDSQDKPSVGK